LLNPNFNEEGGYEVAFSILDIYDDYALAFDYEHNCYARVAYTKDNENDMVSIGEITPCYVLDVTESEKAVLETLRAANGGTYELVDEKFNSGMSAIEEKASLNEEIEKRDTTISEYSTKITELEETISTLNSDRDNMTTEFEKVQGDVATLTAENESLKAYKAKVEKENKQRVIESYSSMLSNEIIENYTARIDEYSNEIDLDKDLAYELKNSNISVFANAPALIPQPEEHIGGLAELLSKYKNK
jgi:chromosome segregation ATPase